MRGIVAGVSLMSDCVMQLRPTERGITRLVRIDVPRRSLFLLSGLSRWHLQHGIPYVSQDRISLTFRTVDKSCYTRMPEAWNRAWEDLEPAEAENAVWPLVCPRGRELHHLFRSPEEVRWTLGSTGSAVVVARPTTVPRSLGPVQDKIERAGLAEFQPSAGMVTTCRFVKPKPQSFHNTGVASPSPACAGATYY
jgi:hypothetical protein